MDKLAATQIFESLSSGIRLDIYRLLVKQGMGGMVSGQIAQTLSLPPNNASFHLKAMTQSGLLTVSQEGRFQRYRANIPAMLDLISYLTEECCSGRPEECTGFRAGLSVDLSCLPALDPERSERGGPVMTILFLCTGNSCRSILAEATFNALCPKGLKAFSAGSHPAGLVHPRSLALLKREGIGTEGLTSKSWQQLPDRVDVVITVCDSAAGEACPLWLQPVLRSHWAVFDPSRVTGSDQEIDVAFEKAYRILRFRIEAMLALPPEVLAGSPECLKKELDRIGTLTP